MPARRKVAVGALICLLPLAGLFIWTRTASFHNWIKSRIELSLSHGDLRAEIRHVHADLWRRTLVIEALKIRTAGRAEPFLEIGRIEARISLNSLISGPTHIESLLIRQPVVRLKRSRDGGSNIEGIDWNASLKSSPMESGLNVGNLEIEEGEISAEWSGDRFTLQARQVAFSLKPQPDLIQLHLEGRDLEGRLGERSVVQIALDVEATLSRERIAIRTGHLATMGSTSTVSGEIRLKSPTAYELAVKSSLPLDQIAVLFDLGRAMRGRLDLEGRINGEGDAYQFTGQASSGDLTLGGFRLAGSSLEARSERPLNLLTALFGIQTDATVGGSIASLSGSLKIDRLSKSSFSLGSVRGMVEATPDRISVGKISARFLGGDISGAATWEVRKGARFAGSARGIRLDAALALAGYADVPIGGLAGGPIDLEAYPLSRGISGGSATLRLEPDMSTAAPRALAAEGSIGLSFTPLAAQIDASDLKIGKTVAGITGVRKWNGDLGLDVSVASPDLREIEPLLASLKIDVGESTGGVVEHLGGQATFEGRLESTPGAYSLRGELRGNGWPMKSGSIESWQGEVALSASRVELHRTMIRLADGASLDLDLEHDFRDASNTRAKAALRNADLGSLAQLLGIQSPVTGRAAGEIVLHRLKPVEEFDARLVVSNGRVAYGGLATDFRTLTGRLSAKNDRVSLKQLRILPAAGVIEATAEFDRKQQRLDLTASGQDLPLAALLASAGRGPAPIDGLVRFQVTGSGTLSAPGLTGEARVERLVIAGKEAGDGVISLTSERGALSLKASLLIFGQRQVIEGEIDSSDPRQTLVARAELKEFDLRPLLALAKELPEDFKARVTGSVRLRCPMTAPEELQAHVELPDLIVELGEHSMRNDGPVIADWKQRRLTFQPLRISGSDTNFVLEGGIDFTPPAGSESVNGHLSRADLNLDGQVNLQILRIAFPNIVTTGTASVKAGIRGSLRDPRLSGLADVQELAMRMVGSPVALEHGSGRIRFTSNQTLIENFRAKANGGDVSLSGGLLVKNYAPDRWQFNIRADGVQLRYPTGIRSVIDATLALSGTQALQILSGTVSIRKAELTDEADVEGWVMGSTQTTARPSRAAMAASWPMALDLRVQGLDTINFRREAFDAMGSAWLRVSGPLANPVISGRAAVSRGRMTFLNREYQVSRGTLNLPERPGDKARFDVEAETDIAGYRVIVTIAGTSDRFQATPHSEPSLPLQQVLNLMTTGDIGSAADTTQTAAQTSVALASALLTEAISKRIELGTRYFGINRFQLAPLVLNRGSDPTARISVGRQVTRDLSITYSTNVASTQDQVIVVEYRLSNRFSFVGTRDQDGKFSLDFRIRKRF